MRWRVLKRLVDNRVLVSLDRRIGFSSRGSAGFCYGLDSAGQILARWRANHEASHDRMRRPRLPGDRFIAHTLAVTELYVTLVELARSATRFTLADFQAEVAAYWPNGLGGWVKPDAYVKLRRGGACDYWWYEADLATESLPTIRIKLLSYLDFVRRGQLGPDGIVPRVLIGVPTPQRQTAIQSIVIALPEPASALFVVARLSESARVMVSELMKQ